MINRDNYEIRILDSGTEYLVPKDIENNPYYQKGLVSIENNIPDFRTQLRIDLGLDRPNVQLYESPKRRKRNRVMKANESQRSPHTNSPTIRT